MVTHGLRSLAIAYCNSLECVCSRKQYLLLPNLLYAELLSIFDCLTNFPSLPVRSGFDELFPVTTFLTVSQSHDTLASMFLYIT